MLAGGALIQLFVRFLLVPLARSVYRPVVHGITNLPEQGAVILAPNHCAALDTGVITVVTPRQVKSLSTLRAGARSTAVCTVGTPAWPRWRWQPGRRSSR